METFILVFGGLFLLKFSFDRFFRKKNSSDNSSNTGKTKSNSVPSVSKPQDERSLAIEGLMRNLEHAKTNRPEIIEEDPELAVKVLKIWANKK